MHSIKIHYCQARSEATKSCCIEFGLSMYVCVCIYVCNASGMQLCPTVCSYLLLPSKVAVAHSSYPSQWKASRDCSSKGTAACYHISVITLTPVLATYEHKLFYHIQAKGGAMFGNFSLFAQCLLYISVLHWTFKLLIAACLYAYCARVNELRSALLCCSWKLLVGIQCCNHFASVVGSVRACTGT